MTEHSIPAQAASRPHWREVVLKYQQPEVWRALWQALNSIVPYVGLWILMFYSVRVSYWLTLPLILLAGGFTVRMFIIFHDCGHGSFFKSKRANTVLGCLTGVLTLTPFHQWRWEHGIHHSSSGDLDRRGTGDIWTLTVQEYLESSRARRFAYRLARNPLVLFVLAPLFLFLVLQRMPASKAPRRERFSVYLTNMALLGLGAILSLCFGFKTFLFLQLGILMVAGSAGIWLFYVQHQFEGVYWQRGQDWDYAQAALQGSSFYKLPKVLQWFSGNIGFHHIHHLSPRIPNYNLERCHKAEPLFQTVKPVTLLGSLKSFTFRLYDERNRRLISFRALRSLPRQDYARR